MYVHVICVQCMCIKNILKESCFIEKGYILLAAIVFHIQHVAVHLTKKIMRLIPTSPASALSSLHKRISSGSDVGPASCLWKSMNSESIGLLNEQQLLNPQPHPSHRGSSVYHLSSGVSMTPVSQK